jgi:hypothetical protein
MVLLNAVRAAGLQCVWTQRLSLSGRLVEIFLILQQANKKAETGSQYQMDF